MSYSDIYEIIAHQHALSGTSTRYTTEGILTSTMFTPRETCFALSAFALGVAAFVKTQQLTAESMAPLAEACSTYTSVPDFISATDYQAYEPLMGFGIFRQFVCIITNFLFELKIAHPAGLLVWGTTISVAQPVQILMLSEASRAGASGVVRYSTVMALLAQILGISVVFPAVWIPASCFGRGSGSVTPLRVYAALAIIIPSTVLSALLFLLHHESFHWRMTAAMLGGPGVAMLPLFLWPLPNPTGNFGEAKAGQRALVNAFIFAGVVAFVGWWYLL